MIRRLLSLATALVVTARLFAGEPDSVLALSLTATPEHPRNSEGAFVTLRSGRISFLYSQFSEGTSDFSPCRIAEIVSDDQGRTWSEPSVRFTPEPGTLEMSVSLLRLASGKIALFSAVKRGFADCHPYLRISSDDGATWTAPRSILRAPGYFVLNNDRVIQTSRGRLILPVAFHRATGAADHGGHQVDLRAVDLWYYSDDEGATWTEAKTWWTLPVASTTGLQEPGVVELADGTLLSWARTDQGRQYECRSRDGGETWSAPQPTQLRSPASPASIKRLPGSSDLLAIFNDHSGQFPFLASTGTYSGRTPLVAAISADSGATWRTAKLLESGRERDYCYTAIHYVGDAVLLAYLDIGKTPGSSLAIRRVNRSWLCAPDDALTQRAKAVLHEILEREESWIKIHAAEALIAGGEAIAIRERFLRMVPTVDSLPYRVGVWRVLANTSPTAADRAECVAQVEKIFLNPKSPDRSQAIETLGKLRCSLSGPMLEAARRTAAEGPEPLKVLAYWALQLSGETESLEKLLDMIRSTDGDKRVVAAYALRWLRDLPPAAMTVLARAADQEAEGTRAKAYLTSAAFALDADPTRRGAWRSTLDRIVTTGTMEMRFEVCNGMVQQVSLEDLPRYAPLLDDAGPDTRVGAALTILYVRARK